MPTLFIHMPRVLTAAVVAAIAALTLDAAAQERDRTQIADRYKWNLADIYPSVEAWRAAKERTESEIPSLGQYKGQLGSAAATLAEALDRMYAVSKEFSRQFVYASMLADQDTRESQPQGMRQEMVQMGAKFGAGTAYLEPEILRIPKASLDRFIAEEPRLKVHRFYLEDIARRAEHTLSDAEEKLLADASPIAGAPSNIFNILSNADFPYPTVTLGDGRTARLDQAAFSTLRGVPSRADRQTVMSSYFGAVGAFSRTFGTTMNSQVQRALFYARARRYPSTLEATLDGPNIPVSVYTRLIHGVNRALPSFHRYLNLRKRMMGLDELHYYDLYAPLVGSVDLTFTPEEAQKHVLAALAPLGAEYVSVVRRAFAERWIDLFPSTGKRSGAYSNGGAYDVHPYILMNYNGKYDDMTTLAHELGHTMHSYYSNRAQPYPLAPYPTFVAEVASTFNESLLLDYMLQTVSDDDTRLTVLGNYLEGIKGTVFRQAQFAEFELRVHEMGRKGQPITGDALASLYMDITKKYYGHDQRVCVVDDYIAHEWSVVPHFYRDFYVFQYATSFTASAALAAKVKTGDQAAKQRYLDFISAGGSKYPIDLLKDAGVDMTTDEPLDLTVKEMNRVMDEMERLLARRAPSTQPR